jgi:hypothetical protein
MAPLNDTQLLIRLRSALANWHITGYIDWKDTTREWVKTNLGARKLRDLAKLMPEYVESGGEIDQVPERRPEWNDHDFHYDLRLPISGRLLYIEMLLLDRDPTDPILYVVSIHDA